MRDKADHAESRIHMTVKTWDHILDISDIATDDI